MRTSERIITILLRISGVALLLAFPAVLMPVAWMAVVHEWLGMGEFPESPLVDYLSRSASLLYGIRGGVYLLLSTNVKRYLPIIGYFAFMDLLFGVAIFLIDLRNDLNLFWTLGEGPPVIAMGAILMACVWDLRRHCERYSEGYSESEG